MQIIYFHIQNTLHSFERHLQNNVLNACRVTLEIKNGRNSNVELRP